MTEVESISYLNKQNVLLHPDTFDMRPRWGAEHNALKLAHSVLAQHEAPVLVDVGAAAGEWTLLAACLPSLRVFAFEPHSGFVSLLRRNMMLNGVYDRVSIYSIGLGAEAGVATLRVPQEKKRWGLSTMGDNPRFEPAEQRPVAVATLDQFFTLQDPTLIKIDAEGAELGILKGAHETIERCAPAIMMEVCNKRLRQFDYDDYDVQALVDRMKELGYQSIELEHENRYFWKRKEHRP